MVWKTRKNWVKLRETLKLFPHVAWDSLMMFTCDRKQIVGWCWCISRCNILGSSPSTEKANKEQQSSLIHVQFFWHHMLSTQNMWHIFLNSDFGNHPTSNFSFPTLPTLRQGSGGYSNRAIQPSWHNQSTQSDGTSITQLDHEMYRSERRHPSLLPNFPRFSVKKIVTRLLLHVEICSWRLTRWTIDV